LPAYKSNSGITYYPSRRAKNLPVTCGGERGSTILKGKFYQSLAVWKRRKEKLGGPNRKKGQEGGGRKPAPDPALLMLERVSLLFKTNGKGNRTCYEGKREKIGGRRKQG